MKKGSTPANGDVVTVKFDQMQDIDVWTWMRITTVSNLPVSSEEEWSDEDMEYSESNIDKADEDDEAGVLLDQSNLISRKESA